MHETTWYFYLVRCRDRSVYGGITTDLRRRLGEHNEGVGAKYTRSRRPVTPRLLVPSIISLARGARLTGGGHGLSERRRGAQKGVCFAYT